MRRRPKTDGNQSPIVHALREAGASVAITSAQGDGFVDLVVGFEGRNYLAEVKEPQSPFVKGGEGGKRARRADEYDPHFGFTPAEVKFHRDWKGSTIHVWRSVDEALQAIGVK